MDDSNTSIEKDQLISMIHFLEKRDEESKKENKELKELLTSLREEYKEDAEHNRRLLKTIETLTQQVSDITLKIRYYSSKSMTCSFRYKCRYIKK